MFDRQQMLSDYLAVLLLLLSHLKPVQKRLLPHLPHMQQSFCFIWGLGESWLLEKCNLREWIGACQLVWRQLKSLGMIVLMRLKLRAQGRVGSKVRKVGCHQTVTSVIVILKTFESHWTLALGPISIMLSVIMAIFLPEGSPDQILQILKKFSPNFKWRKNAIDMI